MFQNKQSGLSLIEVLVASGILGILVVGGSSFYDNTQKIKERIALRAVMESIASDISQKSKTGSSIFLSAFQITNLELFECLLGASAGCTQKLISYNKNSPNYFALYYPTAQNLVDKITSSDPNAPTKYSKNGVICKTGGPQCIGEFEARTFFYASCPKVPELRNPDGTCSLGASHIYVAYQVLHTPKNQKTSMLPKIPEVTSFFTLSAEDILGISSNNACNTGALLKGYLENGKPKCECKQPYTAYLKDNQPQLNSKGPLCIQTGVASFSCPNNQVFRGLKADGTADCKDFADAYECVTESGLSAQSKGYCTTTQGNYWISMNEKKGCHFYCTVAKGGGTCDSSEETDPGGKFLATGEKIGLHCDANQRSILCCRPK